VRIEDTGLGLALSKTLAEAMDGTLGVESGVESRSADSGGHQPDLQCRQVHRRRIRELLTQEFSEAGYAVVTAANGREAVAEVRRQRPDLIVLDVMMPEMNGFDVAAVLRNDPQTLDIPIIILSIAQDRERGFRLGVDRYLTKPINTDVLFREVGALLEQRKSHKRVLVVDEDASAVKTLTEVLKARGYSVTEARGHDLFEKAKMLQPDIIMLSSSDPKPEIVQTLRFEKGLENVLFFVYR